MAAPAATDLRTLFSEPVTNAVYGFDHVEVRINGLDSPTDPLDMAVDGPVINVDMLTKGCVHELVSAFNVAGIFSQRLKKLKFRHRQVNALPLPRAFMAVLIKDKIPSLY